MIDSVRIPAGIVIDPMFVKLPAVPDNPDRLRSLLVCVVVIEEIQAAKDETRA
jgi:hypothetical protein